MLKNILNLEGAQQLSKNEQSSINGGKLACRTGCYSHDVGDTCHNHSDCTEPSTCVSNPNGGLYCIPR